jgi:tetratricopeptide (TPR) repeat protein
MKKIVIVSAALLTTFTAQLGAQDVRQVVAKVMPRPYAPPTCDISPGHFLVSSAATYLVVASGGNGNVEGTSDPEKIAAQITSGIKVSQQAISERGQEKNGAAWYYLGRLYLMEGDIAGADSAFTRAATLVPGCGEDINAWRQRAWLPLTTLATEHVNANKPDSALIMFRQASIMSRTMPQGFYNMGVLFANSGADDSAAVYFKRAQELAANDPRFEKDRNAATFNLAAMYQRAGKHDLAVEELRKYVAWDPTDVDAKRALATSLRRIDRIAEAEQVEKDALSTAQAAGTLNSGDVMNMGITYFNEKKFAEAAEAFTKVLATEPSNRDALYNLANAYLALGDGAKLEEAAAKLVAMEPLSEDSRKLLSNSYRLQNKQDQLLATVTELFLMPTGISVTGFSVRAESATLRGEAHGRQAQTVEGKEIPPAPKTIVVEFLNAQGAVVTSTEVAIPALQPTVKHEITAEGTGSGIVGWRYRVK